MGKYFSLPTGAMAASTSPNTMTSIPFGVVTGSNLQTLFKLASANGVAIPGFYCERLVQYESSFPARFLLCVSLVTDLQAFDRCIRAVH
jgi:hypothetical protein